jgi:ferredoxin-thioredoxin reductase catalytic subunit
MDTRQATNQNFFIQQVSFGATIFNKNKEYNYRMLESWARQRLHLGAETVNYPKIKEAFENKQKTIVINPIYRDEILKQASADECAFFLLTKKNYRDSVLNESTKDDASYTPTFSNNNKFARASNHIVDFLTNKCAITDVQKNSYYQEPASLMTPDEYELSLSIAQASVATAKSTVMQRSPGTGNSYFTTSYLQQTQSSSSATAAAANPQTTHTPYQKNTVTNPARFQGSMFPNPGSRHPAPPAAQQPAASSAMTRTSATLNKKP